MAREGDVTRMEKLLEKFQNPNLRRKKINAGDETKLAPIHYAARYGQYDMLVFLISNGAGRYHVISTANITGLRALLIGNISDGENHGRL